MQWAVGVRGSVSGFGPVRHIPTRMAQTTKTDKPSADKRVEELELLCFPGGNAK